MALTRSSTLLYGGPGAGKSYVGVSSFWDFEKREPFRRGRWVQFGREHNESFCVPEEFIVRIASPATDPLKFVEQLRNWLRKLVAKANTNEALEAVFFDGVTEWGAIYELGRPEADSAGLKFWYGWKGYFMEVIQMIDHTVLNCHVIASARIDQFSKGIKRPTGEYMVEPDPSWLDFKYFPSIVGTWPSHNLSHYWQHVLYVDQDIVEDTSGGRAKRKSVHKVYMLPVGDFWVKNVWETTPPPGWVGLGYPEVLTNPKYDDILKCIEGVQAGMPWKGGKA